MGRRQYNRCRINDRCIMLILREVSELKRRTEVRCEPHVDPFVSVEIRAKGNQMLMDFFRKVGEVAAFHTACAFS